MDNQNKEIDLIEVFGNLFSKIYKNKILFISVILIFGILGSVYNYTKKERYTFSTIATSSIDKDILTKFINDINIKNSEEKKIIPKLEKVSISYDENSNNKNVFEIEITFNDTTNYKNTILQIYEVLEEVEYVKGQINKSKGIIKSKIDNYLKEIEKINKVQEFIFNNNDMKTIIISTSGLSKTKIDLKNGVLELNEKLKDITALNMIHNKFDYFTSDKKDFKIIILFMLLGAILGMFVILIKK